MSKKNQTPENEAPSPIGEIEHGPSGMEAFLDANQKKLTVIGCVLIVLAIGYVIVTGLQQQKKEDAAAEISAATELSELRSVYEKYQDTPAGAVALNKIAEQQWADQRQQESVETLKSAIAEYPEHPMIGSLNDRLATYYLALGEKDQAKTYFQAAVSSDSAVSSHALFQLASIAQQEGDIEAATGYLGRVVGEYDKRHPSFKAAATEIQKVFEAAAPTEVKTAAPEQKKAASAPVSANSVGQAASSIEGLDLPEIPEVSIPAQTPSPQKAPEIPELPQTPDSE